MHKVLDIKALPYLNAPTHIDYLFTQCGNKKMDKLKIDLHSEFLTQSNIIVLSQISKILVCIGLPTYIYIVLAL